MPYPEWINEHGLPYEFTPFDTYRYRGHVLNSSSVVRATAGGADIMQQEWSSGMYRIGFKILHYLKKQSLYVREAIDVIRLEAVISGEFNITGKNGRPLRLRQGQYQVTNSPEFMASFARDKGCSYFVSYYSTGLLHDFGITSEQVLSEPRTIPESMLHLIHEALHHPHKGSVADIYYRKLVTDLLFIHLTSGELELPSELSKKDIAAIYQADAILSRDLSEHYSISKLSGMAGTNAFKLKRGFRLVFKMGVFARLLFRRMEHAKMLLETTSIPIKEVAFESGYSTVGGFINAFRKRFGMTPLDWREDKRRKSE
jgi:AraC-like DNA-binding protein